MEIRINGSRYEVTRRNVIQADGRLGPTWLIERADGRCYEVRHEPDPAEACALPYACDCPDFDYRHRGTGTLGCKHVRVLSSYGILPAVPMPVR
jgi:hypothetical protein